MLDGGLVADPRLYIKIFYSTSIYQSTIAFVLDSKRMYLLFFLFSFFFSSYCDGVAEVKLNLCDSFQYSTRPKIWQD